MRSASLLSALFALLLAGSTLAQVTYTLHGSTPATPEGTYLPTAAFPNGAPSTLPALPLPNAGLLGPPVVPIAGGMAYDNRNAWHISSDGFNIALDANPIYQPFGVMPVPPAGVNPIFPPVAGAIVSGLAMDSFNGVLWACDTFMFWPMSPVAPHVPLGLPQPIPGLVNPASGLGFDSVTGDLWAVDITGGVYHFTPGGVPIGAQPVVLTGVAAPAGGLCVSHHNGPGSVAPPLCSTQIPGFRVSVTDGFNVYDAFNAAPPIPLLASTNVAYGLASSDDFQVKPCAASAFISPPWAGTERPTFTTPGQFNAFRLVGAPPLTTCLLLVDGCPLPTCWFGLWLNPFTMATLGTTTDIAGNAGFGFNIGIIPPGVQVSTQWAITDFTAPLGYSFTPLATVTVGQL